MFRGADAWTGRHGGLPCATSLDMATLGASSVLGILGCGFLSRYLLRCHLESSSFDLEFAMTFQWN